MIYRHVRTGSLTWVTNPNDRYIGKSLEVYGEWSFGEIDLLSSLLTPDARIIEVGANIGAHTVPLAQHVPNGFIVSFEPQRLCFQMLCANVVNNDCINVYTHHMAVGEVSDQVTIPDIDPTKHFNFGGVSVAGTSDLNAFGSVPLVALDDVCGEMDRVDLLKCDAEGMEVDVLKGAVNIINRHRPILYLEDDRADRSEALFAEVSGLDYDVWWHAVPLYRKNNHAMTKVDIFPGVHSFSILCIPKERREINRKGLRRLSSSADHPLLQKR